MRVLHVAEALGGGLLEAVRLTAEATARAGHEVAIAYGIRPETPGDPGTVIDAGVELHRLRWGGRGLLEQLSVLRALRRLDAEWQPDVVHLHSSFAGVLGTLAVGRERPVIFTPHAFASVLPERSAPARRAYRALERLVVRRATLVGAVSASEADLARQLGARRVEVVENGIRELDADRLAAWPPAPPGGPDERIRIVASGRMVHQRRPHACARILRAVRPLADVAWVGGGGDSGRWGTEARTALEQAGVPISGWLPRDEAIAEIAGATVYLHWTGWDGHPLSILEAMARDTIVVASDIPPNRDVVGPRQVCADERAAVALLEQLAADPALRGELLAAQRERRPRWSAARMQRRWLEVYGEVTASRRPA